MPVLLQDHHLPTPPRQQRPRRRARRPSAHDQDVA
jgi:hypothetical protein